MRMSIAGALAALTLWSAGAWAQNAEPSAPGGITQPLPQAAQQEAPTATKPGNFIERLNPDVFGYVKLGYFYVLNPTEDALIGSNSGFRLLNARVGLSLRPLENLEAVVSLEASAPDRLELDPLQGSRIVALRDGYVDLRLNPFLHLRGGQFKAPFNGEVLLPDDSLPFITRSIVSEGLLPPEGTRVYPLSLDRQVGIQASSDRLGGDLGFQYAVAVVNGNGLNGLNNEDNSVSPVARVAVLYKDVLSVGVNGFYNPTTVGVRPVRIHETQVGYGADLTLNLGGLHAFAMVVGENTTHPDTGLPSEQALGAVVQANYVYESLGLEAGARYAYFEPSTAQIADVRNEVTAMVGYRLKDFPARILVQYTLRAEEAAAQVNNDSVDALAQVTF